jgi:hypothetical protein
MEVSIILSEVEVIVTSCFTTLGIALTILLRYVFPRKEK